MLTRIALDDPGTAATLEASARAVTELAAPRADGDGRAVPVRRRAAAGCDNLLDPDSMIASIHIASGLGRDERPHLAQAAGRRRAGAGHGRHDAADACCSAATRRATRARPTPRGGGSLDLPAVRGLVVGRALLFPPDGDVAAAVDIAADLVHGGVAMSTGADNAT